MEVIGSGPKAESIDDLPEEFIMNAISLTTPREACLFSTISSSFRSAAESDALWEKFLPEGYKSTIANSSDPALFNRCASRKELYLHLSDNPLLVDGGHKSLSLEKSSGKICYMLSARDLFIVWGDTPEYWDWPSEPSTKFNEVAELLCVCWLEIRGRIKASMLSRQTLYSAYFVFKLTNSVFGFDYNPVEMSLGHVGGEVVKRRSHLDTRKRRRRHSPFILRRSREFRTVTRGVSNGNRESTSPEVQKREDGWLEVEIGEFFNDDEFGMGEVEMSVLEVDCGMWKGGLVVYGIQIRPKYVSA